MAAAGPAPRLKDGRQAAPDTARCVLEPAVQRGACGRIQDSAPAFPGGPARRTAGMGFGEPPHVPDPPKLHAAVQDTETKQSRFPRKENAADLSGKSAYSNLHNCRQ